MADEKKWYVKASDSKVYGPATMSQLVAWCCDGRIEPASLISSDRRSWMPAQTVPELEMKWIVETEPGKLFGPFNRTLVIGLQSRGEMPSEAKLYRMHELLAEQDVPPVIVEKEVIKEVRVEVPVEVEKIVEKEVVKEVRVEVPVEVEKIVEKEVIKEVRVEVPVEVEKIVEKEVIKEVRVEVPVEVEKIVEKEVIKEVRVEVPVEVEKIVEKEVIKEVRVEVPVEKIVERVIEVAPPPRRVVTAEVLEEPSGATPPVRLDGIFKDVSSDNLKALEAAAQREIAAANKKGFGSRLFGRR